MIRDNEAEYGPEDTAGACFYSNSEWYFHMRILHTLQIQHVHG